MYQGKMISKIKPMVWENLRVKVLIVGFGFFFHMIVYFIFKLFGFWVPQIIIKILK